MNGVLLLPLLALALFLALDHLDCWLKGDR